MKLAGFWAGFDEHMGVLMRENREDLREERVELQNE
jgi:hypothetical protein